MLESFAQQSKESESEMRPIDYARRLYRYIDLEIPPVNLDAILEALDISIQSASLGDDVFGYGKQIKTEEFWYR